MMSEVENPNKTAAYRGVQVYDGRDSEDALVMNMRLA